MEALLTWLQQTFLSMLTSLGFYQKKATILFLGLDNAGKTTLLYKLKTGHVEQYIPTQRANVEDIVVGKVRLAAWDLGGHEMARSMWKDYFVDADAIVYLVDSADPDRLPEATAELSALLDTPSLSHVTVCVLANKSDLDDALPRKDVIDALRLGEMEMDNQQADGRYIQVFATSLVDGQGYLEAFQWLTSKL